MAFNLICCNTLGGESFGKNSKSMEKRLFFGAATAGLGSIGLRIDKGYVGGAAHCGNCS